CKERNVGGSTLLSLDNVQSQLARLQASFTICSAMCCRSASISGIENNLASQGLEANVMKALITDLMQESAQLLVQLSGAKGYRTSHIGARGIMDSRPFQIFEGSNEMLYVQIAETILKLMRKHKQYHLYQFFCNFPLTIKCADRFKSNLSFVISDFNSQRKLVDFGKIISRVIVAAYVTELMAKGFSKNLGDNCMVVIGQDVSLQVSSYKFKNNVQNIEDYLEKGMWQCYC
ncbi:MAG: acyl-CoA dehydrogenase, partial [Pedobacter sp.]